MSTPLFQIRQCERKNCHFRFPVLEKSTSGNKCPQCGGVTKPVNTPHAGHEVNIKPIKPAGPELEAMLDNIRSIYNVGSIFRTADGAGIRHLHLCGITSTPENPRLAKTALGAEHAVAWTKHSDGLTAAISLKHKGMRLWALEGGPRSESLFDVFNERPGPPIVLVVGNEVSGVDPGILEQCERILYLPMQGTKRSLNVAVVFGIASYLLRFSLPFQNTTLESV
jgi:tRNA G18 (ribose-2'-O)-methylase SpoU